MKIAGWHVNARKPTSENLMTAKPAFNGETVRKVAEAQPERSRS